MRTLRLLVSTSLAAAVAVMPGLASAFTTFPGYIQTHLALTYTPPCTICHQSLAGGAPATLIHPFGQAMLNQGGLTPGSSEAEVDAALDDLTTSKTDSDCNGIIDTVQLQDGRDPNPPGEFINGSNKPTIDDEPPGGCANALTPVLYGCGAQLSPAPPSLEGSAGLIAGILTTLGLALVRRTRRTRPTGHRRVRSRL